MQHAQDRHIHKTGVNHVSCSFQRVSTEMTHRLSPATVEALYGSTSSESQRAHSRASRHLQTPIDSETTYLIEEGQLDTRTSQDEGDKKSISSQDVSATENDSSNSSEEEKKPKMTRRQLWTIICMAFANFSVSACFGILAPFFPQEAARKEVSSTVIGLIFGAFELVIFLTSPIFGSLLTKIGAKFMFVSGLFIGSGCVTLFGFLDMTPDGTVYIVMCFVCRSLEACGCSMFVTASFAIVAYEFPGQVATYIGFLETFSGIGMMISPALGGVLYDAGGFKLPFIVMGGLMFLTTGLTLFFLPADSGDGVPFSGSMLKMIRIPSIFIICAVVVASSVALGFLDPTLADHIDDVNGKPMSSSLKGVIFLIAPGIYGFTAPILGAINDKFGFTKTMMVLGLTLMFLAQFFMGPSPLLHLDKSLWLLIVSLIPLGFGVGLALLPTFQECINRAMVNGFEDCLDTYGLVSGLFNSSFSLGAFIGPTLGGYLNQQVKYPWASTYLSFILGGMAIILLVFYIVFPKVANDSPKLLAESSTEERQSLLNGHVSKPTTPVPNGTLSPDVTNC